MEIPAPSVIPSCACNSVTLTFRSSLSSRFLCVLTAVSSKARRRLRLSSTATHWLCSSLADGEHCCGNGVSGSSRGTEELSPLLLDTRCHATHFANFLAVLPSFPDSPTIVVLLATKWSFFSAVSKKLENIAASSRRVLQNVPQRDLLVFCLHQSRKDCLLSSRPCWMVLGQGEQSIPIFFH